MMTNGSIKEEDKTAANKYALNTEAPKYIKQILMDIREETNSDT